MTDESMYSQEYYCNHMATTTRWDISLFHSDKVACTKWKAPLVPLKFNREWEITLIIHTTIIFDSYKPLVYVWICDFTWLHDLS